MGTINLLYKSRYEVSDGIEIVIPKVGDVLSDEDSYYSLVSALTAMPIDMIAELDDIGVDFSTIDEYELFLLLFNQIKNADTSLIFGELNLSEFNLSLREGDGALVLLNQASGVVIDRSVQSRISSVLRKIHGLKKDVRKPANDDAKKYMLDRAREKRKRSMSRSRMSQIESLIISMVNTEQFKYGFYEVLDLSIYQFNQSVRQVIKKINYDNRMYGVYSGTINTKELSQDDLSWFANKL